MNDEIKLKLIKDLETLLIANRYVIISDVTDKGKIAQEIFDNLLCNYDYYKKVI